MPDTGTLPRAAAQQGTEHFDVLIVGAGISGVGGNPVLGVTRTVTRSG
jgi:hypothetical protein